MEKHKNSMSVQLVDFIAFVATALYLQSVLTVAHHVSLWPHDGTVKIVEAPNVVALVVALALVGYSWYRGKNISALAIISLTVLVTATIFWLSGLRTNFYY